MGPNTAAVATWSNCAPGTTKFLCPWHHKNVHLCTHHMSKVLLHRYLNQPRWCLRSPLSSGVQASLGWSVVFLIYLQKFFHSHHSPREQNGWHYPLSQCPKTVSGQRPPSTPSVLDWQHFWWHCGPSDVGLSATWKCHTFSGVLFTKEINLCMTFCVGQQVANMC